MGGGAPETPKKNKALSSMGFVVTPSPRKSSGEEGQAASPASKSLDISEDCQVLLASPSLQALVAQQTTTKAGETLMANVIQEVQAFSKKRKYTPGQLAMVPGPPGQNQAAALVVPESAGGWAATAAGPQRPRATPSSQGQRS